VTPERRNVLLLAGSQALLLTNAITLLPIGTLAGQQLAVNKAFATLPTTTAVIGAALAAFPASLWMKRAGRRAGFLTGAALGVLGALVAALGIALGNLTVLCLGTFISGGYSAFGQYYRFAAADAAAPEGRARAISYVLAGGLIGGILGPEASKLTIDLARPKFLASYLSLVAFGLLAAALISRLRIPAPREEGPQQGARPLRQIAAQPVFVVAALAGALGYAVMNLLMTATPLAMGFCGHPYSAAASVIAAHVVAMFAPSFFTGALIQRFGVLTVILAGVALMVACVLVALSGQELTHFSGALVLLGLGWNFMYVGGTTLLGEAHHPSEKAKVQGLNEILVFGAVTLSAFGSGLLVNAVGWSRVNVAALPPLAVAGLAAAWLLLQRRRRRSAGRTAITSGPAPG
jgi:predicted MFS family arabinose efflux permease